MGIRARDVNLHTFGRQSMGEPAELVRGVCGCGNPGTWDPDAEAWVCDRHRTPGEPHASLRELRR